MQTDNQSKRKIVESGLIVLEFSDTSTLVDHFVSSPIERENRDR